MSLELAGRRDGRKKEKVSCCVRLLKEFLSDSSIHGVKYLSDEGRHWTEKFFWLLVFLFTIPITSYLFYDSFSQWYASPIIVSSSEKFMNVWQIPFPAITICPRLNPSLINQKAEAVGLEQSMEIFDVKWRKESRKLSEVFSEIQTNEGSCYTFNMMNYKDLFRSENLTDTSAFANLREGPKRPKSAWSLEGGYSVKKSKAFPYRAFGSGDDVGLTFKARRTISDELNEGYKLAIHLPCELPRFEKYYYRIPSDKSVTLFIQPSMIVSESLRFYAPTTRQCYFQREKTLDSFQTYTRSNCQVECIIQKTKQDCNCSPSYFPQTSSYKACDLSSECVTKARKNLTESNMRKSIKTSQTYFDHGDLVCDCLTPCTSLHYNGEISYSDKIQDDSTNSVAKISILLKDDDFMFSKRSQVYSFTAFLANFGGILGLFLGVSVLSFIEIIFFLMFRQYSNNYKAP